MRHLQELREVVADPADYVRRLKKDKGKKIIGYVCSYLPEELVLAAGAHPLRLFGTKENIHLTDAHLQSYCCSLVRGILEGGLSGETAFLDGMVFPHTCDSMQRLSDIWRMNIPYGFHLDVVLPVKLDTESARQYMTDVLEKFRNDLDTVMDTVTTEEALREAIVLTNGIRRYMGEIYELCCQRPGLLKGEELHTLVRAAMVMDRGRVLTILQDVAADLKAEDAEAGPVHKKRLLLAGGFCNHPAIYPMIEEAGGVVVWDDFCTGARYFEGEIDGGLPPVTGMAARLIGRSPCPAKHAGLHDRAQHIVRLVREKGACGVVFLLLKFCDPHAFDIPDLKKNLDEADVPVMVLEIDDPPPAGGQLKTRFEAFLEML